VPEVPEQEVLIGVDGGASEVKAHEVVALPRGEGPTLGLGAASFCSLYARARGFRPLPVASQLLAHERGKIVLRGMEGAQGRLWLETGARAILAVAAQASRTRARLGVCMPGLKTADGRGIAVMRNGPRIPDYLDRLEAMLAAGGLVLTRPVARLSSDGEASAHGEEMDEHGLLRGIACAYYVGGGTGLAEALKIGGAILGFDALRGSMRKAWQMESSGGRNLEDLLSPRGMNAAWAALSGRRLPLAPEDLPERRALRGDDRAASVLREAAEALAELAVDRMLVLRRGSREGSASGERAAGGTRGARIAANTFLDRIVFGQRLGAILADTELRRVFRDPAEEALARRIVTTGDGALRKHYLDGSTLRPGLLVPSLLREAPAIGAAAIEVLETAGAASPQAGTPGPLG
jgi:hypothetical protein